MRIAIPGSYEGLIPGKPVGAELSRLLGYLVGDGGTTGKSVKFTNHDPEVVADLTGIVAAYGCVLGEDKQVKGNYWIARTSGKLNAVKQICKDHGLDQKLAVVKEVPPAIMSGTPKTLPTSWGPNGTVMAG